MSVTKIAEHKRPSPLELFQQKHCRYCEQKCNPGERRFLLCLLAALLDTTYRANALDQFRGAHY
jgi:hypothetical protein